MRPVNPGWLSLARTRALLIALLLGASILIHRAPAAETAPVHPCAGAGRWYPADPAALRAQIEKYMAAAKVPAPTSGTRVRAVVVPHAGYDYSGPAAAHAYKLLRGQPARRVVLLAFSHSAAIQGASLIDVAGYQTPLGTVATDRDAIQGLLKNKGFTTNAAAHATEHSDENQLPFLQCALGPDFRLIPILVGEGPAGQDGEAYYESLATALRPLLNDQTILVVSSDFTHYGMNYDYTPFRADAAALLRQLDGEAAAHLLDRSFAGFTDFITRSGATVCGRSPLSLMLKLLAPEDKGNFLAYARSGDPAHPEQPSVGYCVLAWVRGEVKAERPDWIRRAAERADLSAEECKTLLRLARASIAARLQPDRSSTLLRATDFELTPRLMAGQGCFVTLKIGEDLRGCIGALTGAAPLYENVMRMAGEAAFGDPRFSRLTPAELARVRIDISALLTPDRTVETIPFKKLAGVEAIRIGKDGLLIRKDGRSGLLLPQVPVEQSWGREEFLKNLCLKAGLPEDAWRGAEIQAFGAQVFSE